MLTREERELMERLAKPPKCMHDPKTVIEREYHWQCGQCGLIARKRTIVITPEITNEQG